MMEKKTRTIYSLEREELVECIINMLAVLNLRIDEYKNFLGELLEDPSLPKDDSDFELSPGQKEKYARGDEVINIAHEFIKIIRFYCD